MAEHVDKKQRTAQPKYELIYWPGIPGRGEYVRLVFEAAGVEYVDVGNATKDGIKSMFALINPKVADAGANNPPVLAPPVLRISGDVSDDSPLVIHQTHTIIGYVARKHGLVPASEADALHVSQIAQTALDFCNEAHDTHHPIANKDYYEDQKSEALAKAADFRAVRIPKFFGYFERVLAFNKARGKYLVGDALTYADTTVWQTLDGVKHAFPKQVAAYAADYPLLFAFYDAVKAEARIAAYLASDRRQAYGDGIFRHYPELDLQEGE